MLRAILLLAAAPALWAMDRAPGPQAQPAGVLAAQDGGQPPEAAQNPLKNWNMSGICEFANQSGLPLTFTLQEPSDQEGGEVAAVADSSTDGILILGSTGQRCLALADGEEVWFAVNILDPTSPGGRLFQVDSPRGTEGHLVLYFADDSPESLDVRFEPLAGPT